MAKKNLPRMKIVNGTWAISKPRGGISVLLNKRSILMERWKLAAKYVTRLNQKQGRPSRMVNWF